MLQGSFGTEVQLAPNRKSWLGKSHVIGISLRAVLSSALHCPWIARIPPHCPMRARTPPHYRGELELHRTVRGELEFRFAVRGELELLLRFTVRGMLEFRLTVRGDFELRPGHFVINSSSFWC